MNRGAGRYGLPLAMATVLLLFGCNAGEGDKADFKSAANTGPAMDRTDGRDDKATDSPEVHRDLNKSGSSNPRGPGPEDKPRKKGTGKKKFNPSAIARLPDGTGFMLLAARQNVRVSFDWQGRAVAAERLSSDHQQSEGLAITADGRIVIADEAGGKGKARLAVYPK